MCMWMLYRWGGIDSWGAMPLEQYRIPAAPREFRFVLRPVVNL